MVIQRGEIWWADLGEPRGSSPAYRRPVLIVQSNVFNRSRIETVVVAAITSNLNVSDSPGNVELSRRETGLAKDSTLNVSQIIAIDRSQLEDRVCRLPPSVMRHVDDGLRLVLDLS